MIASDPEPIESGRVLSETFRLIGNRAPTVFGVALLAGMAWGPADDQSPGVSSNSGLRADRAGL